MRWRHSRKGIIEGELVRETEEWVLIRATKWQALRSAKPGAVIPVEDQEVITVRKEFLTEIKETS